MQRTIEVHIIPEERERILKVPCPKCNTSNCVVADENRYAQGVCECKKCGTFFHYRELPQQGGENAKVKGKEPEKMSEEVLLTSKELKEIADEVDAPTTFQTALLCVKVRNAQAKKITQWLKKHGACFETESGGRFYELDWQKFEELTREVKEAPSNDGEGARIWKSAYYKES